MDRARHGGRDLRTGIKEGGGLLASREKVSKTAKAFASLPVMRHFRDRLSKIAIPVLVGLLMWGCVTSSPYKADASHPIRTITITHDVSMPDKMLFSGLSESFAAMFGGVAGVLATIFREGEDFSLPQVLRADLAAELAKNGKFKVRSSGPADAEVRIWVREYGFMQAPGFMRRHVKPILTIETQMIRKDGTMIWKSGVVVNQTTKGTPELLPEDLKNNRKVAADALYAAARIWAAKTAASLK